MSSMRSASSRTRMRTLLRSTSLRLRKSYSLPGVAIEHLGAFANGLQLRSFAEAADDHGGAEPLPAPF